MNLDEILTSGLNKIDKATTLQDLEALRVAHFGRKGVISGLMAGLRDLDPHERKEAGAKIHQVRTKIIEALEAKKTLVERRRLEEKLASETVDITQPGRRGNIGALHPITRTMDRIHQFFSSLGFDIIEGPEIEHDYYNFEALNIPEHHPARAMFDTFYFNDHHLLRTHTSNTQIHYMEEHSPPIQMIGFGRVYRHDSDVTHSPMFHQVEGLLINEEVTFANLKGILTEFMQAFFEKELALRFRPSYFPFTEPSAEVDIACVICEGEGCRVCKNTGWLEVLGCGMVHPNVLKAGKIDTNRYQGFAFGMGVERLAMLRYQINDLRLFYENDLNFLAQFR